MPRPKDPVKEILDGFAGVLPVSVEDEGWECGV